ncbi:chaperone modulator CbpM [Spirosoma spitsbergense]|jgi:chaperone modulatory protein CbpM|uniref:chaperone modulator CbpM n=1 Tax=Spirosoma spitsbergense TaxID=431554 RepID=UPI000370533C|nr:chaperone modulator CbpM [Spirosoma spitsbergense]
MQPNLILINEFCVYHHVEVEFVQLLEQRGLIETTTIQHATYVPSEQLPRLEKFVRLHQDLAIHPDDLDVVNELLERLEHMQQQLTQLQNRLVFYEPSGS